MKVRICTLTLVIAVIVFVLPIFPRFAITDARSGKVVFQDKLENYKEFYINFTHSVNRTPVREYYRISGNMFILEKADFYSYGAGMPETGEYGSGKPSIKDGAVRIDGINKPFRRFTYIAGTYANHSLNTDTDQVMFSKFVKPQTSVTFEIRKISLFTMLRIRYSSN